MRIFLRLALLSLSPVFVTCASAIDFVRDVQPIFHEHCLSCHGAEKQRGGYRLDARDLALRGGDSGNAAIVPGKSAGSPLFRLVSGSVVGKIMPPKASDKKRLTLAQVATLRAWIDAGADWPASASAKLDNPRDWWSLKPLVKPAVPGNAGHPIDAFLDVELAKKGLRRSVEADPRTLIRRLYFDLIGLPPTPAEMNEFAGTVAGVSDPGYSAAVGRLIDRLLASPHYGERWARHWLDIVHYGESHGYDKDKPRPNAWPYRDYVIRAFNDDRPYTRFLREQLAGDVLYPGTRDGIEALGFLAAGPWDFIGHVELPETKIDGKVARHLDRDDMVSTTLSTFNSLTVHCAQCHNHKFDPIMQEDYYALQAVFAAIDRADRKYDGTTRTIYAGTIHHGSGNFLGTGSNGGKPRPIHILPRGDVTKPGKEVGPGTLGCLPGLPARFDLPKDAPEGARRAALAEWLAHRDNPLTWRSIVNRVWQFHFGRGLVDTPNDFGRMGTPPSHPELLDWLAVTFRDDLGGSLKKLHRLIVTSAAYQQASAFNPDAAMVDGDNRLLWRMNRRKLEAEAVRDSILAVAGKLDRAMGGPSFQDFVIQRPEHSPHYKYELADPEDPKLHRRSIYRFLVRSQQQPFMTALDCADPSMLVEKRNQTITPLQALTQLNNQLVLVMAKHFAERVERAVGTDLAQQAAHALRLALSRSPSTEETAALAGHVRRHGLANACRLVLNLNEFAFVD